mgnify:CR=1 FL=1
MTSTSCSNVISSSLSLGLDDAEERRVVRLEREAGGGFEIVAKGREGHEGGCPEEQEQAY